ncbi:redox-regulated ATPase YchF, partial [Micrococcus luteus]|nr:redox-regulated ATPase YchF [Micrococcus luteus]
NQFLANIRETHAIAHVVRCFEDDNVVHVSGRVDPIGDIEVINTELALADLASVERALDRAQRTARSGDKEAQKLCALLERIVPVLNEAKTIRSMNLDEDDLAMLKGFSFITAKPVLYVANVREDGFTDNP